MANETEECAFCEFDALPCPYHCKCDAASGMCEMCWTREGYWHDGREPDEGWNCELDDHYHAICDSCQSGGNQRLDECEKCDGMFCAGCLVICEGKDCGVELCIGCAFSCDVCSSDLCGECRAVCERCESIVCDNKTCVCCYASSSSSSSSSDDSDACPYCGRHD